MYNVDEKSTVKCAKRYMSGKQHDIMCSTS